MLILSLLTMHWSLVWYRFWILPMIFPLCESLKDTIARVLPYYEAEIQPQMLSGKRVLIVAHGNSLRAR